MKIVEINGKWNLLVKTLEEKEFTQFEMSEIQEDMFEFKNDTLNFSKLIKYWKKGAEINALLSGNNFEIPFEFKRVE